MLYNNDFLNHPYKPATFKHNAVCQLITAPFCGLVVVLFIHKKSARFGRELTACIRCSYGRCLHYRGLSRTPLGHVSVWWLVSDLHVVEDVSLMAFTCWFVWRRLWSVHIWYLHWPKGGRSKVREVAGVVVRFKGGVQIMHCHFTGKSWNDSDIWAIFSWLSSLLLTSHLYETFTLYIFIYAFLDFENLHHILSHVDQK